MNRSASGSQVRTSSDVSTQTGCEILINSLLDEKVDTIFGYPGGVLLDVYDVLYKTPQLKHILVRHEQGATHAADGYARVTGKPGVVLVTSGPGATNTVTGIATAYMDSIPMVVLTGQVASGLIGNDAFQEADIVGITRPITKHSYLVKDVNQISQTIQEAFYLASTGRPGPVLIDLPVDVLKASGSQHDEKNVKIRGYNPVYKGHQQQIEKAAQLINQAERPLIYAGGGVNLGDSAEALKNLAVKGNIPVTNTLNGLGGFPGDHPLFLGMVGMHGTWTSNMAIQECDVLVAIGARFEDRVTGKIDTFSPHSQKIHIDIDPSNITKNVKVDVPIVGHVGNVLPQLSRLVKPVKRQAWQDTISQWQQDHPLKYRTNQAYIAPQYVIEKISEVTDGNAVIVTDVGQNQMWTAQYYKFKKPRTLLSSGGLGTMGYSLPAAIGAALADPKQTVFSISGDGGFQMNSQELATAVYYKIPLKIVILNNGFLGMVRQWQDLFRDKRYSHTYIKGGNPDFVKLAAGYGAEGVTVTTAEDVLPILKDSLKIKDRPYLMEFRVSPEENVFPMVPAGASLSDMIEGGVS